MPATSEKKRRDTVPPREAPAGNGHPHQFISARTFAQLAGISGRVARKAIALARAGKPWRGVKLEIRRGRGAGGEQFEVAVASLPVALQAKWHQQQPGADLREQVAHHIACIEEDRRAGRNGERFINLPWTQEEREARHKEFSKLPTSAQDKAKKRLRVVQLFHSLAGSGASETQRYDIAAKEAKKSVSTIRNWVGLCNNLDRGDWLVALAPNHKGCQVISQINPDVKNVIWCEYFTLTKRSIKSAVRRATPAANKQGLTMPSYDTIRRAIEREPHWFHVLTREGREALAQLYPTQRRDYSSLRLHEIWCADGRKADVFVRWEDDAVSRPIVVAWIDVRSRVCLGYAIGRTESADLIRLAFKAAAETAHALPEAALMDNGRGFAAKIISGGTPNRYRFKVKDEDVPGILTVMGIEIIWALPYSGRSKPIESWWRTLAEMDKRFGVAYCGNSPEQRPEDFDSTKAVPIAQYRRLLAETLNEYHMRPHRGDAMDGRAPRAVYEELLQKTAIRQPTREQLRTCLLAAERIKLDPVDGSVRLLGNRYWSEEVSALPRHLDYVVRYNPENAAEPVDVRRGEKLLCEVPLLERTGFRDQQAAKDHLRAGRQFTKARKQEAAAKKDMRAAAAWLAAPGSADEANSLEAKAAAVLLPVPKIVQPLRPMQDLRSPKKNNSGISKDDVFAAIARHFGNARKA